MNRLAVSSAALGTLAWLLAPLSGASRLVPGSLEHTFLFAPLVATPLALAVLASFCKRGGAESASWLARLQPFGAVLLVVSFLDDKGPRAGALAAVWLLLALALLFDAARQSSARNPSRIAAHVFLVVGATWLVLYRVGISPGKLSPERVFLGATHFHFSGFLLQVMVSAIGRRLRYCAPRLLGVQRGVALAAVLAILLLVVGNMLGAPVVKLAGVVCMVASTLALAFTTMRASLTVTPKRARGLLWVSAAALVLGMLLALVYGIGELTGAGLVPLDAMLPLHGFLNAFGFTLCGLLGHLVATPVVSTGAQLRVRTLAS